MRFGKRTDCVSRRDQCSVCTSREVRPQPANNNKRRPPMMGPKDCVAPHHQPTLFRRTIHFNQNRKATMLVQLSPWRKAETSIKASNASRRRSRIESDDNKLHAKASFITTSSRRALSKWKQHSSELVERQPLLVLTSSHKICVLGKTKDSDYE